MSVVTDIFERDVKKGFIPKEIIGRQKDDTLLLINCLQQIERNVVGISQSLWDLMMKKQLNYPDMFMKTILQDHKRNNSMSRYPQGWFDRFGESLEGELHIDDCSDLSCYNEIPVSISIFEIESIPLFKFDSVSAYMSFILSIYSQNFENIAYLFSKELSQQLEPVEFLNGVLANIPTKEAGVLLEFYLYKSHHLQALQNPHMKSILVNSKSNEILSRVSFPERILEDRGSNFYGQLLMRVRSVFA
jgi:hypothetical protein